MNSYMVTAPNGHGIQFGIPIPTITGLEQAQAFVDARIAEGSDFIKIVMETDYGFQSLDLATATAWCTFSRGFRRCQGLAQLAREGWGGTQEPLSERERQVLRLARDAGWL